MKCDFETIEHHPETKEILSREEEKILLLIKENPFITQRMLQEKTGISLGTIKRILPRLQEKNVLVREGGKRFGKWLINHTKDNEVQHG